MEARVREETIVMPTYPVGEPSPFPPFDRIIYPYPMLDDIGYEKVNRTYRAVLLENDYLKVTVLPELGGKIWGVWDKRAQRDMFYTPKVVKPGLVSLRGAWTAGGIEFNFPIGHHVYCMSPVHCLPVQEKGGRATVWIHQYEYLSGMHWAVAISLSPDACRVETTLRMHNRTDMPQRYYVWSNAAVPASDAFEFICTAPRCRTSGGGLAGSSLDNSVAFPVHNGIEMSFYRNIDHAADLFAMNPEDDFFGYYDHDAGYGVINVANRFEAVGQKIFTWGTGDDGLIWDGLLSDGEGSYCEIQRGRFEDQSTWRLIMPQSVHQWQEVWFPVRDIGKPVKATRNGAIGIKTEEGSIRLGVQAVSPFPEAAITLDAGGKREWEHRGSLKPGEIYTHTVKIDQEASLVCCVQDLAPERKDPASPAPDSALCYRSDKPKPVYIPPEAPQEPATAEECAAAAIRAWESRHDRRAEEMWDQALELDPGFVPALLAKSGRHRWAGQPEEARDLILKALSRDPENPEALYYEGSLESLYKAARHPAWRSAASLGIARRYPEYGSALEQALAFDRLNPSLYEEWIRILQARNRPEEAGPWLDKLMEVAPYNLFGIAVRSLSNEAGGGQSLPAELVAHLKDRAESAMVLIPLLNGNQARRLANWARTNGVGERARYILEYWHPETALPEKAESLIFPSGAVFPHRPEEYSVLRNHPDDPIACYLLGIWLYAKGRKEEGIASWEKALSLGLKDGGLARNLGWAYWKDRKELKKAAEMYIHALTLMPDQYRLYVEQNILWDEMGKPSAERLAALESAPSSVRDRWQITALRAELLVDLQDYDRALDLLTSYTFLPWEGARGMRGIYLAACLGRGRKTYFSGDFVGGLEDFRAALQYPCNLGVGQMSPPYRNESQERFWAGMGYMATGQKEEAMNLWKESLSHLARRVSGKPMPPDAKTAAQLLQESARPDEHAREAREKFCQGFTRVAEGDASGAFSLFSEAARENVWPW